MDTKESKVYNKKFSDLIIKQHLFVNDEEYDSILSWILNKQENCLAQVNRIDLNDVLNGDWFQSKKTGNIEHKTGEFFKIIGVDVKTDLRESGKGWKQPMIDQGTESSVAGFLCKIENQNIFCLAEAKFEPGNYGKVLISPSLQVTYSNLLQAHGGRKPRFSEFFENNSKLGNCVYSQWLPEDGGRFYLKRVKYMIVIIHNELQLDIDDNFRWISVNTLKRLLYVDNLLNPHVRSLLALF